MDKLKIIVNDKSGMESTWEYPPSATILDIKKDLNNKFGYKLELITLGKNGAKYQDNVKVSELKNLEINVTVEEVNKKSIWPWVAIISTVSLILAGGLLCFMKHKK
jgi:hypothetical protein